MKGIEQNQVGVGDRAPDFDLPMLISGVKKRFHLGEALAAHSVVLAFYPHNWDPETARQLTEYQAARGEFGSRAAEVVGISVDSILNTTAWEREIGPLEFPICADFWPHGEVSRAYGVFQEQGAERGSCERALVVVARTGEIAFRKTYSGAPTLAETLAALAAA